MRIRRQEQIIFMVCKSVKEALSVKPTHSNSQNQDVQPRDGLNVPESGILISQADPLAENASTSAGQMEGSSPNSEKAKTSITAAIHLPKGLGTLLPGIRQNLGTIRRICSVDPHRCSRARPQRVLTWPTRGARKPDDQKVKVVGLGNTVSIDITTVLPRH